MRGRTFEFCLLMAKNNTRNNPKHKHLKGFLSDIVRLLLGLWWQICRGTSKRWQLEALDSLANKEKTGRLTLPTVLWVTWTLIRLQWQIESDDQEHYFSIKGYISKLWIYNEMALCYCSLNSWEVRGKHVVIWRLVLHRFMWLESNNVQQKNI